MNTLSLSALPSRLPHPLAQLIVARMRQRNMDLKTALLAMGYQLRPEKKLFSTVLRLQSILSDDYLGLYQHQHCYDLKYTPEAFLEALIRAVGLTEEEYGSLFGQLIALKPRDQYRFRMRANIHSDVLMQANPRFLVGMVLNPFYHVELTPYFQLKDFTEQDRLARALAVQHYRAAIGKLPLQASIHSYLLYYTKQGEDEVLYRCYYPRIDEHHSVVCDEGKFAGAALLPDDFISGQ